MKWNKYTIKTTTQAADLVSGILIENGINGIEVEDKISLSDEDKEKLYINFLPKLEDDGLSYISFYLEESEEQVEILEKIRQTIEEYRAFTDIGEGSVTVSLKEDTEWIDKWKEYFKPFMVDDILIKPTWEQTDEKAEITIEIDPGTVFGTGMHETTQLCIRQMRKYLKKNMILMDAGCGSGILSIAGIKLGATRAVCVDIDENVLPYVDENMEVNGIEKEKYEIHIGNILEDDSFKELLKKEEYDIVVANILADIIIPMSGKISFFMKKGGYLIVSGIINTKEEEVLNTLRNNPEFEVLEITRQKDWVSITAKRV